MQIAVRYVGTSAKRVATFAIYANGFRVGFIKNSGQPPLLWRAVQWRHAHLGDFSSDLLAGIAVLEFYQRRTYKQLKGFRKNAAKLEDFKR